MEGLRAEVILLQSRAHRTERRGKVNGTERATESTQGNLGGVPGLRLGAPVFMTTRETPTSMGRGLLPLPSSPPVRTSTTSEFLPTSPVLHPTVDAPATSRNTIPWLGTVADPASTSPTVVPTTRASVVELGSIPSRCTLYSSSAFVSKGTAPPSVDTCSSSLLCAYTGTYIDRGICDPSTTQTLASVCTYSHVCSNCPYTSVCRAIRDCTCGSPIGIYHASTDT